VIVIVITVVVKTNIQYRQQILPRHFGEAVTAVLHEGQLAGTIGQLKTHEWVMLELVFYQLLKKPFESSMLPAWTRV
jgi:hypothetical protein